MRKFLKRIVAFSLVLVLGIGLIGCAGGYNDSEIDARISALEEIITLLQNENTALKDKAVLLENAVTALKNENASLKDKAAVLASAVELLKNQDATNAQKIVALEAAKAALQGEIASLTETNTNLVAQGDVLSASIADLLSANSTQAAKIASLETANSALSSQVSGLLSDIGNLQTSNQGLLDDVADLQGEISTLNTKLGTANSNIAQLILDLASTNGDLLAVTNQLGDALDAISALQEQLDDIYVALYKIFMNPYGYASLKVTDFRGPEYTEYVVNDEVEFADALLANVGTAANPNKNVIIKITRDMNMGYNELQRQLAAAGKNITNYSAAIARRSGTPEVHPIMVDAGVSVIYWRYKQNFMVYSDNGSKIKHASNQVQNTTNIVFRNISFAELWEWDDVGQGAYNGKDWDHFTLEADVDGIWIDHCTFDSPYDGLMDAKQRIRNITFSWNNLCFDLTEFHRAQIDVLDERLATLPPTDPMYPNYWKAELEKVGTLPGFPLDRDGIIKFHSGGKKGFNLGNGGSTSNYNFSELTVTFHHVNVYSLDQRFPRMRKGDAHLYNIFDDGSFLWSLKDFGLGSNYSIGATEGSAVLLENSYYRNVDAIRTNITGGAQLRNIGKAKVVNSVLEIDSVKYLGGTDDPGTQWLSSSVGYDTLPFHFRNYEVIPYDYTEFMVGPEEMETYFDTRPFGAGTLENFNWKAIDPSFGWDGTFEEDHRIDDYINFSVSGGTDGLGVASQRLVVSDARVSLNGTFTPANPTVYNVFNNLHDGKLNTVPYVLGTDYTLDIDDSDLDVASVGVYEVIYKFTNIHRPDNIVYRVQTVTVYDPTAHVEIASSSVSNELAKQVHLTYTLGSPVGHTLVAPQLAYIFSDDPSYTLVDLVDPMNTDVTRVPITNSGRINWMDTKDKAYMYYTVVDTFGGTEHNAGLIEKELVKETIVPISSVADLMTATKYDTKGKYFILQNDIDFGGHTVGIGKMNFAGTLDGNGFTISNIDNDGFGLFRLIRNAVIMNITFDDIYFNHSSDYTFGFFGESVDGYCKFENVTYNDVEVRNFGWSGSGIIAGTLLASANLTVNNIQITNSNINAGYSGQAGGFFGSIASGATLTVNDMYASNFQILAHGYTAPQNTAGLIAGANSSAYVTLNRIVMENCTVGGANNLGGLFGTNSGASKINDVLLGVNITSTGSNVGYLSGTNSATLVASNVWLITAPNDATMISALPTGAAKVAASAINQAWLTTNLATLYASPLWDFVSGAVVFRP